MRARAMVLAALVGAGALSAGEEPPKRSGPPVTRISYWSIKPGKDAEARTFWRQWAAIFDEMKTNGLIVEYQFLEPLLHTGQDWNIAYIWVCRDIAAYGAADAYFSAAVAKVDPKKISVDYEATFDGSKHRDELWRGVDLK